MFGPWLHIALLVFLVNSVVWNGLHCFCHCKSCLLCLIPLLLEFLLLHRWWTKRTMMMMIWAFWEREKRKKKAHLVWTWKLSSIRLFLGLYLIHLSFVLHQCFMKTKQAKISGKTMFFINIKCIDWNVTMPITVLHWLRGRLWPITLFLDSLKTIWNHFESVLWSRCLYPCTRDSANCLIRKMEIHFFLSTVKTV